MALEFVGYAGPPRLDTRLIAACGFEELDPVPDADGVYGERPGGRLPLLRDRPRTSSGGAAGTSSGVGPRGVYSVLAAAICGLTNEDVTVMVHAAADAEADCELLGDAVAILAQAGQADQVILPFVMCRYFVS